MEDDSTRTTCVCDLREQVVAAGGMCYLEKYLAKTERTLANNDQRGFYKKYLRSTVGLEGQRTSGQLFREEGRGWHAQGHVRRR